MKDKWLSVTLAILTAGIVSGLVTYILQPSQSTPAYADDVTSAPPAVTSEAAPDVTSEPAPPVATTLSGASEPTDPMNNATGALTAPTSAAAAKAAIEEEATPAAAPAPPGKAAALGSLFGKGKISELQSLSDAFTSVVEQIDNAVVHITVIRYMKGFGPQGTDPYFDPFYYFFGPGGGSKGKQGSGGRQYDVEPPKSKGQGTGFIIDASKGYVVTNNHVIEGADKIKVSLKNGKVFEAKVIGTDPKTDVGVIQLQIKGKKKPKLTDVEFGDSDTLKVGEWVLAVGNPFGLSHTVTAGIISAKGRADVSIAEYQDFIQTDAAINPGNSGGPLLNLEGKVVGMNTAIFTKSGGYQGIGFAVPSGMIESVVDQLIKNGKVARGVIGVYIQDLDDALRQHFKGAEEGGVLVTDVIGDSPAEKAGVQLGDIIMSFDGKTMKNKNQLRNTVAFTKIGKTVKMDVLRNGKKVSLDITVGSSEGPRVEGTPASPVESFGIKVKPAGGEREGSDEPGVVIVDISPNSQAYSAGLMEGDVILEVNKQKIDSTDAFDKALGSAKPGESLLFLIERNGQHIFVVLSNPTD